MNSDSTKPAEFQRDIRLGLVLYGGVSLAIYMNGTTNELFRAVRGRGVYFLLKHLLDADITVDVASGASAGGINGMFLAFALANGREFGTCADLWRKDGDLNTLLNDYDEGQVPSVLDSEHYRSLLENGFREMWLTELRSDEPEVPSETRELDLFVAGTDFYGRIANEVDATGRVIETKQHRTVFLLKHRHRNVAKCQLDPRRDAYGRWPNEKPRDPHESADLRAATEPSTAASPDVGLAALAKLAQITSCFPGAFAPVHFLGEEKPDGSLPSEVDFRLQVWGKLGVGERYFVDGGVLDNKPFTTTLDTIFRRPAHRRVCRHLLYLEPDPERFAAEQRGKRKEPLVAPSFLSTVLDAVTRLPAYESIAGDLARVTEHNAAIQRFGELVEALTRNGVSVPPGPPTPTGAGVGRPQSDKQSSRERSYRTARLLGIAQRVTEKIAEALDGRFLPEVSSPLLEGLRKSILPEHITPELGLEFDELLRRVDVDYYTRRAMALTYYLEALCDNPEVRALWSNVNNEIEHLEIIGSAIERVVLPSAISQAESDMELGQLRPVDLWKEILDRTRTLLDYAGLENWMRTKPSYAAFGVAQEDVFRSKDYRREEFRRTLEARVNDINAGRVTYKVAMSEQERTVLEASDERLRSLIRDSGCSVGDFLERFEREDRMRFPLELAGGVRQRDHISVIRLSPVDAQAGLSKRPLEKKICGETFGHFGAFLKRSWRSNDILWGRLDGIARLVETLMEHSRFSTSGGGAPQLPNLDVDAVLRALGEPQKRRVTLGRLFPHLQRRLDESKEPTDPIQRLLQQLEAYDANEPQARAELVSTLIDTAQLDALCEDLPKVVADAAQEQFEWGQLKIGGSLGPTPTNGKDQPLDGAATAAQKEAREARKLADKAEKQACVAEKKARRAREQSLRATAKAERRTAADLGFSAESWQFKANVGALNPSLVNLATRVFAQNALKEMSTTQLDEYFRKQYAVGNETATGAMPATVLVDLGARAAVVTESALLSSGELARKLRGNKLYTNVVHRPIRGIAGLAAFVRRAPTARIAIIVGSLIYALLSITTNVLFAGSLYAEGGAKRAIAMWMFGLIPAVSLVFSWTIWRSVTWKRIVVAVVCLGALVSIWFWWPDLVTWVKATLTSWLLVED